MVDNEHINGHLKRSLEDYRLQPRISSFDRIQEKMKKEKRRRMLFFILPGFLFLLGTIVLFMSSAFSEDPIPSEDLKSDPSANVSKRLPDKVEEAETGKQLQKSRKDKEDLKNTNTFFTQKDEPGVPGKTLAAGISASPEITLNAAVKAVSAISEVSQMPQAHTALFFGDSLVKESPDHLPMLFVMLPVKDEQADLVLDLQTPGFLSGADSLPSGKKVQFFIGGSFNPQAGTYFFRKNRSDLSFADPYLENKRQQNAIEFNFAYGIRAGVVICKKWELMAGFGYQRYVQDEKLKAISGNTGALSVAPGINYNTNEAIRRKEPPKIGETYRNIYNYWNYSFDITKIYEINKVRKVKAGMGFCVQKLKYRKWLAQQEEEPRITAADLNVFYFDNTFAVSRLLYSLQLKAGWIEDLNKTIQLQVCPNIGCSLNSMFDKQYVIKQNSINLGLECLLLFKIR